MGRQVGPFALEGRPRQIGRPRNGGGPSVSGQCVRPHRTAGCRLAHMVRRCFWHGALRYHVCHVPGRSCSTGRGRNKTGGSHLTKNEWNRLQTASMGWWQKGACGEAINIFSQKRTVLDQFWISRPPADKLVVSGEVFSASIDRASLNSFKCQDLRFSAPIRRP